MSPHAYVFFVSFIVVNIKLIDTSKPFKAKEQTSVNIEKSIKNIKMVLLDEVLEIGINKNGIVRFKCPHCGDENLYPNNCSCNSSDNDSFEEDYDY